ncbi:Peptidase, M23/M37 family [gamma proteobacterium HdN1]|nr:Peptidase, M23/M37 family [gamma proteobacterium HdN1]
MTIYSSNTQADSSGRYPRRHIILAGLVGLLIGFALALAPKSDATVKRVVLDLPTPVAAVEDDALNASASISEAISAPGARNEAPSKADSSISNAAAGTQPNTRALNVRSGDSLSTLLARAELMAKDQDAILAATAALKKRIPHLQPGQTLHIQEDHENQLTFLSLDLTKTDSLIAARDTSGQLSVSLEKKEPVPFTTYTQGTVRSSFFQAAQAAGLSHSSALQLTRIFDFDIDFSQDIHKGDSFKVVYEELYVDGQKLRDGAILAAEFTTKGKEYTAVRFKRPDGSIDYYSKEGTTLRKAFIRAPIDYARISSHFDLSRLHPVLHSLRAHKGTDYAATRGTPIKATGDGVVKFSGRKGGYGNVVILDHGRGYETLYAHMQNFAKGMKTGTKIKQGQVIGYVGSTGLATGPHLHYEFYVNGQVKNPVTVKLPGSLPIAQTERAAFVRQASKITQQMNTFASAFEASHKASQLAFADKKDL